MRRVLALSTFVCFAVALSAFAQEKREPTAEEKAIVELTNKEREAEKAPPLKINAVLSQVARAHSENMAKTGVFDHVVEGKSSADRVKAAGYRFSLCGENISKAEGEFTPEEVMKGWMNSKLHRDNIMNAKFREIGVGVFRTEKGVVYYTQVFAVPR